MDTPFTSLAETLGTLPDKPGAPAAPRIEDIAGDAQTFCKTVLNSLEFRQYIINGLTLGELPSAIITRLMDHAWGKPVERLEVQDTTPAVEDLTPEELESRAARLSEMARLLRRAELFDEPLGQDSVH